MLYDCMKTAVFFERDGIINQYPQGQSKPLPPLSVDTFRIHPEVGSLITKLRSIGLMIFVTTHQPQLATGELDRRELDRMHLIMRSKLDIDDVLICPHENSDPCSCAKPNVGLFKELEHQYRIDIDHSYVISDKWQDAAAAQLLGCVSVMLDSPWVGNGHRDYLMHSFTEIEQKIDFLHRNQNVMMVG
jgi:histidinol-phosphate phosphatase family protein